MITVQTNKSAHTVFEGINWTKGKEKKNKSQKPSFPNPACLLPQQKLPMHHSSNKPLFHSRETASLLHNTWQKDGHEQLQKKVQKRNLHFSAFETLIHGALFLLKSHFTFNLPLSPYISSPAPRIFARTPQVHWRQKEAFLWTTTYHGCDFSRVYLDTPV